MRELSSKWVMGRSDVQVKFWPAGVVMWTGGGGGRGGK